MHQNHLSQIDGLRTIAVVVVMFAHWTSYIPGFGETSLPLAVMSVNMFFVLSGFLISLILIRTKEKVESKGLIVKQFYIRRFLRIFPLYYLVILGGLILDVPNCRVDLAWLATYMVNLRMVFTNGFMGWFPHFWSLSVEEQYYIFFPIIMVLVPKKYYVHLGASLVVVGLLTRFIPFIVPSLASHKAWFTFGFTTCCLDSFGLGFLLAYCFHYKHKWLAEFLKKYTYGFVLIALFAIMVRVATAADNIWYLTSFRLLTSIAFFGLIGKAAYSAYTGWFERFLKNKVVIYIGKISYGLYIYHFFVIWAYSRLGFTHVIALKNIGASLILYTATTFVGAAISYRYFEDPINKLKKHFEYRAAPKKHLVI